eukprot:MONOS_9227.1-p1 / transcript=MONOS_9227.1 / gene=MONOS_9227 / organism=Monocercomonoides_exilis_PA203 / gene_product=unspecified product / transcript_product=unspecified product / location=Mono_scaffold00373:2016-2756(-) / protein_length=210 / sequence_SO=supercontig / SO=protein_coding / is_pseudo=false
MLKLLSELERCSEIELNQNIEKMNKVVDEMDEKELQSVFIIELFKKIDEMMDEQKISLDIILTILKRFGFNTAIKNILHPCYKSSLLGRKIEKMIIDEYEKKDGRNEKLIVDLCECHQALSGKYSNISKELSSICVPCLLKVALKKEEDEKTQKEVEMALLALSCIDERYKIDEELYLDEITEIIKYHQEHHNLTQLAYQSAWQFLINRC